MTDINVESDQSTTAGWDPALRNNNLLKLPGLLLKHHVVPRGRSGAYDSLSARRAESRAERVFRRACGACILQDVCAIQTLDVWRTRHPIDEAAQFAAALQERPGQSC